MFTRLIVTRTLMCSVCPGNGTEETREESKVEGECEFVDSSESECGWVLLACLNWGNF